MYREYSFLEKILESGEKLVWTGKPEKGNLMTLTEMFLIPLSVLWLSFAVYWTVSVIQDGIYPFAVFGFAFICAGMYFVFGRFILCNAVRKNTVYAITDRRIIMKRGGRICEIRGGQTVPVHTYYFKNGNATIYIGSERVFTSQLKGAGLNLNELGIGAFVLINIADVSGAHKAISEIK